MEVRIMELPLYVSSIIEDRKLKRIKWKIHIYIYPFVLYLLLLDLQLRITRTVFIYTLSYTVLKIQYKNILMTVLCKKNFFLFTFTREIKTSKMENFSHIFLNNENFYVTKQRKSKEQKNDRITCTA